eukprot:435990_1
MKINQNVENMLGIAERILNSKVNTIRFETKIKFDSRATGHKLLFISRNPIATEFINETQHRLRTYFKRVDADNEQSKLEFIVNPQDVELEIQEPPKEWWERLGWFEYEWIYWLLLLCVLLIVIGLI